jgi:hypothetical protein
MVSSRESMEAGNWGSRMVTNSTAATPDQITAQWRVGDGTGSSMVAPEPRVRVCSSVEKHAAVERVEQAQVQALALAQQSRQLVVEGASAGLGAGSAVATTGGRRCGGRAKPNDGRI